MRRKIQVLFIGESWFFETTEYKGFDKFTSAGYQTAVKWIQAAIERENIGFTHLPCHEITAQFPDTLEELQRYDVILLSDVGANTFLLHDDTFYGGKRTANKLEMLKEFVLKGGGIGMIGGYLSFQGIEGKGNYAGSAVEEILPVYIQQTDDRVEMPQGYQIKVKDTGHPILKGVPQIFPYILGYNRLKAKKEAVVLAEREGDPLIAIMEYGKGRTLAYATDCSPHWASKEMCEWEYYSVLWGNIVKWLAKEGV